MRNLKLIVLLIIVILTAFSCDKKETPNPISAESFVFGHFYGFCEGETCIEIFKIEDDILMEDTQDLYPSSDAFYSGDFVPLSNEKYEQVADIVDFFPTELLDETETVIGIPDAGDWGGLYIEYKNENIHKFWLIDQFKSNVPTTYHSFIDEVNEKIALINN